MTLRFGRYESLFRIASGGMAEVFAARVTGEAGFEKRFAIKRILPMLTSDETFVTMFLEEARVAAQLSSPYIAQTLDVGRDEHGAPFIVQELVLGVDLVELITTSLKGGGHVPLDAALSILIQAARGLHDAHEARATDGRPLELVHRDVSPHNLLVGRDGRVRLTDFGIARVSVDRLVATQTGTVKGKYAYFAPEQARGKPTDRRADVFGLGVVAWELLTGARLFARQGPVETLAAVEQAEVPDPRELRETLPEEVARAVLDALAREAEDRTPTADAFASALRAAARAHDLDPSERAVAELMAARRPPRLVALEERLSRLQANPTLVTLDDIEAPVDSGAETLIVDDTETEISASPFDAPSPAERRHAAEPSTVLLGHRDEATEVVRDRSVVGLAVAMIAVGLALGLLALLLLLR